MQDASERDESETLAHAALEFLERSAMPCSLGQVAEAIDRNRYRTTMVLEDLLERGRAHRHPAPPGSKGPRFSLAPSPAPLAPSPAPRSTSAQEKRLARAVQSLNASLAELCATLRGRLRLRVEIPGKH